MYAFLKKDDITFYRIINPFLLIQDNNQSIQKYTSYQDYFSGSKNNEYVFCFKSILYEINIIQNIFYCTQKCVHVKIIFCLIQKNMRI